MIRKVSIALATCLIGVSSVGAQEWARDMFTSFRHEFGTLARNAKTVYAFEIENKYATDVHIASVRTSCGCTSPTITQQTLKAYEKGAILAKFNTHTHSGKHRATLTVVFDKPKFAEVQLVVTGYVRSDVEIEPQSVSFGDVDHGSGAEHKVRVRYTGGGSWQLEEIQSSSESLHCTVIDGRRRQGALEYEIAVRLLKTAAPGYLNEQLVLIPRGQPAAPIPVRVEGNVVSLIPANPCSIFFGVVKSGEQVTRRLMVRAKEPFRVTSIHSDQEGFLFDVPEKAAKLHLIPIAFVGGDDTRKVSTKIEVETDMAGGTTVQCEAFAAVIASEPGVEAQAQR